MEAKILSEDKMYDREKKYFKYKGIVNGKLFEGEHVYGTGAYITLTEYKGLNQEEVNAAVEAIREFGLR